MGWGGVGWFLFIGYGFGFETCVGIGTGSAFEEEGLQSNGLKAVLETDVVFGRACGATSNTLRDERTIGKTCKILTNYKRINEKHKKLTLEPPPCGSVSQKTIREIPKIAQASQGHPKEDTTTKMTPNKIKK